MTDEDKRSCKSETLEELAEVRAKRRCLITRADRMQKQVGAAAGVLRDVLAAKPGHKASVEGQRQTPDETVWPSYAELAAIHEDMWNACNRIHVLNGRLREWGVID